MKRFVSLLLVAMLIVTSFATVGFAAGSGSISGKHVTAEPGATVDVKVTVSGEFANFEMFVDVDAPLSIESISGGGVVANPATGKVVWAAAENVGSVTFTVKVKVADDAVIGKTYPVKLSNKFVSDQTLTDLDISVSNGSVEIVCTNHKWTEWTVIEEPTCGKAGKKVHTCEICGEKEYGTVDPTGKHTWGEWDVTTPANCTEDGEQTRKCSVCGHKETKVIPATGHTWSTEWSHDGENHWHVCTVCGEMTDVAAHTPNEGWECDEVNHWHVCSICEAKYAEAEHGPITEWQIVKEPTAKETGLQQKFCETCGAVVASEEIPANGEGPIDPGPGKTGDPTGMLMMIGGLSLLLLILLAVALYMIKRKASAK